MKLIYRVHNVVPCKFRFKFHTEFDYRIYKKYNLKHVKMKSLISMNRRILWYNCNSERSSIMKLSEFFYEIVQIWIVIFVLKNHFICAAVY